MRTRGRIFLPSLLLVTAMAPAMSQPARVEGVTSSSQDLREFEGQYAYHDGGTLFIVASDARLIAVIGEAKYPLRAAGPDVFTNAGGDSIPFVRAADQRISAFKERGQTFARLSSVVSADVRQLLSARAPGADGRRVVYRYEAPTQLADGIRVGEARPELLARDVAERLVNGVIDGTYADVRSILVYRKGELLLEEYFYGFDRERPHPMRSLTKSVVSMLAGAAVDRELLRANDPVLDRLGYASYQNADPRKAKITLTDLLSHQSGLACNDYDGDSPGNEVSLYETTDWMRAFVDLPMVADPGTTGRYCSGGILAAGRIVERAAGKPLPAFAQDVLLSPLGIRPTDWKWAFTLDRSARNEFAQIYLRPRDMLKLGLLIHQRGEWEGRRVVSAQWIDAAVARQSRVDDSDYGLGIWHRWYRVLTPTGERRIDTIMLSGNGGQKVYIVPSLDLVVAFTGGAFNAESPVNDMMAKVLLPSLLDSNQPQ